MKEEILEYVLAIARVIVVSIPWVLPILVFLGLYGLHRLFKRTKNKIVEIKKKKEKQKKHVCDKTTAQEYLKQYKELAQDQLMQDIRTGVRLNKSIFLLLH